MTQFKKPRVRSVLSATLMAAMVFGAGAVHAQSWQPPAQPGAAPTGTPAPTYPAPAQPTYQTPQPGYQSPPPAPAAPRPGYQQPAPAYQSPPPAPGASTAPSMGTPAPAPVALPGDPPQWRREDVTDKQRYETARKEAVNGYDESRKQCRTLGAAERKGCEAEARRNYDSDMAALKSNFGKR
ncbi:hypothetical protein [Bordetella genomosp. 1]|uniref:Uncharacterized protein n=1 Tax=Bordetella genomosp. 1 TaxID=1395607 RepID=A0ABX4EXH4_9BORD|nr:hypothetical protein [Bordetella genomosp. 1]OZI63773.1 hypothetical protein CAL27_14285 [Bordetella genomosp. 1]